MKVENPVPQSFEETTIRIEPLTPQHAADAARLHIEGQPGTFLTRLGPDVLTVVYQALPNTDGGFGFVAVVEERIVGFVSATTSVGKLFAQTSLGKAGVLLPALTKQMLKQPSLLPLSVKTVFYPFLARHGDADGDSVGYSLTAELLSIMVADAYRSHGIGTRLVDALVEECSHRSIGVLDVTVDAANPGACQFYEQHEFAEQKRFTMYGREMCQYQRHIDT